MTTKIMTIRLPLDLYSGLCGAAGEAGISVSAHARALIEREHHADAITRLREELLQRLDQIPQSFSTSSLRAQRVQAEILLFARAIAADRNPQIVQQVQARLKVFDQEQAKSGGVKCSAEQC